jgi:hypothetical protein
VLLNEFSIRTGSGGNGLRRGGDGVVRELQFLQPLTVGILSERRAFGTHAHARLFHCTHTSKSTTIASPSFMHMLQRRTG